MIKCNINKSKNHVWVREKGSPHDMAVEVCTIIEETYRKLRALDNIAADAYKRMVIGILIAPDSPVWKEREQE